MPSFAQATSRPETLAEACAALDLPAPPPLRELDEHSARAIYKAVQNIHAAPRSAEPVGQLAMVYHAHGMRDRAEETYFQAESLDSKSHAWSYLLGYVRLELGRWREAVESFERARARESSYAPTWQHLGHCYRELGDLKRAEAAYAEYIRLRPRDIAGHLGLGEVAQDRGDHAATIEHMRKVLEIAPDEYRALYALGVAYQNEGQKEKGEELMRRSREVEKVINRDDPLLARKDAASTTIGSQQRLLKDALASKRDRDALEIGTALLARAPDEVDTLISMAEVYRRVGRHADAETTARKALRFDPMSEYAWPILVSVLMDQGKLDSAREAADHLVRIRPRFDPGWGTRGIVYQRLGNFDEAIRSVEEAFRLRPDRELYLRDLGSLLFQKGDLAQARAVMERYVRMAPNDQDAARFLAGIRQSAGLPQTP
jgi:tetratricopeptide (TPR) repeat protein